jgi:hypothetical protein
MPSYDSVAGPLIFIGLSVFQFNEFNENIDDNLSSNNE